MANDQEDTTQPITPDPGISGGGRPWGGLTPEQLQTFLANQNVTSGQMSLAPNVTDTLKPEEPETEEAVPKEKPAVPSSLERMLALLKPKSMPMTTLNVGQGLNNPQALNDALEAQKNAHIGSTIGKSAELLGSGISGSIGGGIVKPPTPAGTEVFNDLAKQGDLAVAQYQAKKEAEKDDPNSPLSKAFKQYAKQFGINVQGDFTASMGEKLMPFAFKAFEANEQRNAKHEDLGLKLAEMGQQKETAASVKAEKSQADSYQKMRHDMETFRGNQAAQRASLDILSADKALQLIQGKDPNSLTTQDLGLLASELGKIATGGVPTQHGTSVLMPNNLQTKYAELKNFLLSKPTDAQAGAYITKNMDYLNKMKDIAKNTIDDYRTNIAKGYKNKVKSEDYEEAQNDYGLGEENKKAKNEKSVSSAQLDAYVKEHPPVSREEAKSLLTKAGYNVQ